MPTIPEHMSSPSVLSGARVTRSLALCVMFCRSLLVLLAIVLSVLRFTDSHYPFDIFKLYIHDLQGMCSRGIFFFFFQLRSLFEIFKFVNLLVRET